MLAGGANTDSLSADGSPPFLAALTHGDCKLAALLVAAGADLTLSDSLGRSPLACVVRGAGMLRATAELFCALLLVAGTQLGAFVDHPMVASVDERLMQLARHEIDLARQQIAECELAIERERFGLMCNRSLEVCIGLQSLELPAFVTIHIIDFACPFATCVALQVRWKLVVAVKHFCRRERFGRF